MIFFAFVLTLLIESDALLLNDLPTPSFVLDMDSLQRRVNARSGSILSSIPPLLLPARSLLLVPSNHDGCPHDFALNKDPVDIFTSDSKDAICYLHTSVLVPRKETTLAKLDLEPSQYSSLIATSLPLAKLVLGLNNHHVGSYYWARSAGSGASMDAPGVMCTNDGILCWESNGGPIECNSNDGKRSEWVNFLRPGDNVQLLPLDAEDALFHFVNKHGRVFGVSSKGRPMGSEPQVVCEWIIGK